MKTIGMVLTLALMATPSGAVVGALALDWTLGDTLDHLEEVATETLETAGDQAEGVVMEAGQAALNVIGGLRTKYREMLGETIGALTGLERRAFEDARQLVAQAEEGLSGAVEGLDRIVAKANRTLSQLPGVDSLPLVQTVTPQYFVRRPGAGPTVTIRGMNLAEGDPGVISGYYTYQEVLESKKKIVEEHASGTLAWGDDLPLLELPEDTQTVSVTIEVFTGQTVNLMGGDRHRFAEVDFDASAKTARLRTLPADRALKRR